MDLLSHEAGRIVLLVLAAVGFAIQWDDLMDVLRERRKGGDDGPSDEGQPPPPVS